MGEVARKTTAISLGDAKPVLEAALQRAGVPVTARTVGYALATFKVENRNGEAVNNHNWGNVSSSGKTGDYWRPPWYRVTAESSERDRELHQRMLDGKAPKAFLAWPSHAEGAREFVRQLYTRRPTVLRAAQRDDPTAYAAAIHATRYCPDFACRPETMGPRYRTILAGFRSGGLVPSEAREPKKTGPLALAIPVAAGAYYLWRRL